MCIRDRLLDVGLGRGGARRLAGAGVQGLRQRVFDDVQGDVVEDDVVAQRRDGLRHGGGRQARGLEPVSYTHLDVYKRQVHG